MRGGIKREVSSFMSVYLAQTEIRNTTASGDSDSRVCAWNSEDPISKSGSGRSPAEGNGNPQKYSCLERNLAGYIPWSCQELDRTERLNKHTQSTNTLCRYCSVVSNSLRPHAPARLHCPWNFPGKNKGVGYRFLLLVRGPSWPGMEPASLVSPALVGRFFTTVLSGLPL